MRLHGGWGLPVAAEGLHGSARFCTVLHGTPARFCTELARTTLCTVLHGTSARFCTVLHGTCTVLNLVIQRFLSMFVIFCRFLSIFVNFCHFLSIFVILYKFNAIQGIMAHATVFAILRFFLSCFSVVFPSPSMLHSHWIPSMCLGGCAPPRGPYCLSHFLFW